MRNIYDELGHWDLGDEGNKFDRYRKNLREIRKQSIWAIKKNSNHISDDDKEYMKEHEINKYEHRKLCGIRLKYWDYYEDKKCQYTAKKTVNVKFLKFKTIPYISKGKSRRVKMKIHMNGVLIYEGNKIDYKDIESEITSYVLINNRDPYTDIIMNSDFEKFIDKIYEDYDIVVSYQ